VDPKKIVHRDLRYISAQLDNCWVPATCYDCTILRTQSELLPTYSAHGTTVLRVANWKGSAA